MSASEEPPYPQNVCTGQTLLPSLTADVFYRQPLRNNAPPFTVTDNLHQALNF